MSSTINSNRRGLSEDLNSKSLFSKSTPVKSTRPSSEKDGLQKLRRWKYLPIYGLFQRRRPTCQRTTSMYQPTTPWCQFQSSVITIKKTRLELTSPTDHVMYTPQAWRPSQVPWNHILFLQHQDRSRTCERSTTIRGLSMKRESISGSLTEDWARADRRTGLQSTCLISGLSRPWWREWASSKKLMILRASVCYIGILNCRHRVIFSICSERIKMNHQ